MAEDLVGQSIINILISKRDNFYQSNKRKICFNEIKIKQYLNKYLQSIKAIYMQNKLKN